MPRVLTRTARKDYPDQGIKKGDTYYRWSLKTGPRSSITYRSKNRPTRSQLTTSAFLQAIYEIEDRLPKVTDLDEARELAEELRSLGDEEREKFDNMPEGLQQGDVGQKLESRAEGCEEAANEIENICDQWSGDEDLDETEHSELEDLISQIQELCINYD